MDSLNDLINKRIEAMRPKLMDMTRKNPLLKNVFSPSSASFISIVDEKPQNLLDDICADKKMYLAPLPPLDDDKLPDEKTDYFLTAYENAQRADQEYLDAIEGLKLATDDRDFERQATIERDLKDRVRAQLGLPKRPRTKDANDLVNHAKIHGIDPSKTLPASDYRAADGRHSDDQIQTLLLPDALLRKGRNIFRKQQTAEEERGLQITRLVIGYLNWSEPEAYSESDVFKSPLVVIPVVLGKERSSEGEKFFLRQTDDPFLNPVLERKLEIDASLDITPLKELFSEESSGIDIEKVFEITSEMAPKACKIWEVKREATIGTYPFQGIDLYQDLDPQDIDFSNFNVLESLLVGKETEGPTGTNWEDFDVDGAKAEQLVPHLVMNADSSQFTALSKVANGENVALEGPPGSGKSQTIVNAIANAIFSGKKVLFVAQKMTALEVVNSRLQSLGLDKFVLPMVGAKSDTDGFYSALENRLKLTKKQEPRDIETLKRQLEQQRNTLTSYIALMQEKVGGTNLTVHEVMGLFTQNSDVVPELPFSLRSIKLPFERFSPSFDLQDFKSCQLEIVRCAGVLHESKLDADSPWRDSSLEQLDLNALSRFRNIAERACGEFDERFTAECDSDRDFISNVIANNSIEQINLAIEKGNWWRSSDDENWCELVSRSSEIEPMLRSFISSYSTLDDLTAAATKLGFDLLSAVQIREQISTYQTFLTLCDVNESDVSEINRLKTAMEEKLERIEAVASEVENLRNLGISLSPRDFVSCYKNLSSISSESLVKRACAEIGIKDIVSEIRDAEAILKKAYEDFDHKQPLPQTVKVKEALNVISSAGFFTRFGNQYKESLAHAKGWYGYDLKSKLDRGLLIGKLDASLKLCRKLDGLTIGSSLAELHATDSKWLKSLGNRLEDCIMSCERTRLPAAYVSKFLSSESTPKVFLFLESRRGIDTDWTFVDQEIAGVKSAIKFAETEHEAIRTADSFLKKSNLKFTDVSAILSSCDSYLEVGDMRMDLINQMGLPRSELNLERAESYLSLCKTISELHPSLVEGCFLDNSQHQINLLESYSKLFEGIDSGMTDLSLGKGSTVISNSALEVLESVRAHWSDQTNFQKLIQRQNIINEATEFGFESILTCLEKEGLLERVEDLIAAILASNLKEVAESKFGSRMLGYSGTSLNAARSRLKDVDTQLIALAPKAVESKCQKRANPPSGVGRGRKSEFTELALLNHELSKKRRTPPRKLLKRARVALMELFPCWMMVPTSVAQQLPREEVFDLVIIDEASQMTPETAISALMRSKQVLISGDTNQLPPTNFYQGLNDNIDDEEDEDLAVDEESILEIANAMLYPKHRLQWHYRSKHEELIAFSNHYVYDNDLVIFPTPHSERKNMGVRLVRTDGVFNKKINPGEAQIMVEQVVEFMKEQPRRSLGVVVMNRDQMEQIYSMINRKADEVPEVARYMDYWSSVDEGLQRFFVKNLENVQGDERDVIFIGTVYGKNPEGKFYHQFGPIGQANGKRRLNVLFSRAKEEIVTFSSIPMDLFNPNPNNEGANMLKLWLQYSATKRLGEKIVENEGSRAPDSPFEEHVIQVVKDMGFIPVPQVGVSNYSIDIGIKHSSYPMGYLCGVECDGATYHSAKSARDRDRLRQEVLEGLGWTLYRIWSTDWFRDPFGQSKHLKTFLESLLEEKLSQLSPETDNVSTELKSPLPREKTPASDHNLFVEEGSKVEIQYLNGSAPGVTAKFWITSQQVFENSALTADPFRKCSVSTPIAVAMIDSRAGDVVSYVAGNQSIEVKILSVS